MALFRFTKAILKGEPIDVFNNGKMRRDFTYIDDVIEGVVRVMERRPQPDPQWSGDVPNPSMSRAPFRLYKIGNDNPVERMDPIRILEACLGRTAQKRMRPLQAGDVVATYADVTWCLRRITRPQWEVWS